MISQSGLKLVQTDTPAFDLLHGSIDVLIGHQEVEGQMLQSSNVPYRNCQSRFVWRSRDGASLHRKPRRHHRIALGFLIAVAEGWMRRTPITIDLFRS